MEWRNTITNGIDSNGMDEDEPIESNSTGRDPGVDGSPGAWRMAEHQQHQNIEAAALRNRLEASGGWRRVGRRSGSRSFYFLRLLLGIR